MLAVADQGIQIRGAGVGHPDPEIGGDARSQKNFFGPRASVWSKNTERAGGSPDPSPRSAKAENKNYSISWWIPSANNLTTVLFKTVVYRV